ncbi:WD40 repeat domain-containing protein [Endozoicomonas sp. ONNA2]|uniref:WD40 repeat domain-containing protein n=1 Tax=Endozoicomonas sp. ONNA2 TaxID=2828741 RepID=UPI002147BDEF|nr:WD40 repeat domain-containing protein [Endozoicomonas sp. ONNA2]
MQPIASGSAAVSRMVTGERQSLDDLKPSHTSVGAAYNKQISEIPESSLNESLVQLTMDSPPESTFTTSIDERNVSNQNNPMLPQSEASSIDSATDDSGTESSSYDSDSSSSSDGADTGPACQKALTAKLPDAAANNDSPVSVKGEPLQGVAPMNSQSGTINARSDAKIDAKKPDIFQCQNQYLELEKVINFGRFIRNARFSPTGKNLVINGCDRNDDGVLVILRQTEDGNWSQNREVRGDTLGWEFYHGKARGNTFGFEFNRLENRFLSISCDGYVTVSKLNSDGFWEEAVVLEHSPYTNGEDFVAVKAGFSPRQDKIMTYDFWADKIKVLREDSNGQWIPLTQPQGISHQRHWGQPSFKATDHYLLTDQGLTATIWAVNDDSNCLEEKKVIECSLGIGGTQMSDDERHAVVFGGNQVIFMGCNVDGKWSQIGEACHPEYYSKARNDYVSSVVGEASFNASGQYALSLDSNRRAIISGYDDDGSWVVKTEIQDCANVRFSPSGRKLLAHLYKPQDCNITDDPLADGQDPEDNEQNEGFIKLLYDKFKLWDCSSDRLDNVQTFVHSGSDNALFSPSENFLLSYGIESNFVCIWGYDEEGNLVERARVSHQEGTNKAAFNAREDSVLTRACGKVVKIQRLDSQGKRQGELVVEHQKFVLDARFSRSGLRAYTISKDGTAGILGRDNNGQWMKQAMTNRVDGYSIKGGDFNGLENHFLTYGNKIDRKNKHQPGLVQLWGIDDDGQWAEKEQIKLDYSVESAKFSPDDDHLLIQCTDRDKRGNSKHGTVLLWKLPASLPGTLT